MTPYKRAESVEFNTEHLKIFIGNSIKKIKYTE